MKTGLVVEGGASRAAFSCGAMDLLLDQHIYIDYVIGASAGISYGVSYSSRQRGRNYKIFQNYMTDKRYMGMRHLLGKGRCYYNLDFVFGDIPEKLIPFRWNEYNRYGETSYAVLTNIETGKPEYMHITEEDREWYILRASCALPILFQPIEIKGKMYMDGGITDSIPFEHALEDGCDRLVVILTREREYIKKEERLTKAVKLLYPKYPELSAALSRRHVMYNEQREKLFRLEKEGRAVIIAPDDTRNIKRTERKPSVLLPFYQKGYQTAEIALPAVRKLMYE